MPRRLSEIEQETLLHLGAKGSGGNFDQMAMAKLFAIGLVEVRSSDRRLSLTDEGRKLYEVLRSGDGQQQRPKNGK